MSSVVSEKFKKIRDHYWAHPQAVVRKADLLYVIGELDREYFLHDHERQLSRRWMKQRDTAENTVDELRELLQQCLELIRETDPAGDVTEKVETVLSVSSDRSRRLSHR